jgi:hypothetical protein
MNNVFITADKNHRFYEEIKSLTQFIEPTSVHKLTEQDTLYDFTLPSKQDKISFLKQIKANVYSDLSIYNSDDFKQLTNLKVVFSSAFFSPKNAFEYTVWDSNSEIHFLSHFHSKLYKPIKIETAGIGFIFPRILVQIINEAHFAIHEDVANAQDIDTACLYGVSYPVGPVEWGKKSYEQNVWALLDELYSSTKDPRYKKVVF